MKWGTLGSARPHREASLTQIFAKWNMHNFERRVKIELHAWWSMGVFHIFTTNRIYFFFFSFFIIEKCKDFTNRGWYKAYHPGTRLHYDHVTFKQILIAYISSVVLSINDINVMGTRWKLNCFTPNPENIRYQDEKMH